MRRPSPRSLKRLVFLLCLVPLPLLVLQFATHRLGANPIEAFTRGLGEWALRFLLLSLCVTPLKSVLPLVAGWRRMLGLYAFFYACLHMLSYLGLDQAFDAADILADILKRKYMTVGMVALLLLVPLAVTSTKAMIKRLGAVRWRQLHRLTYLAAILAVLHFYLLVKADVREPLLHALILAVLLGWRLVRAWAPTLTGTPAPPPYGSPPGAP
ncbi:MAG: sulfoxide reductase heme-binding subunit YedZ [Rhodospirillales bacterium]|nr:sulfoxide reductase heme-binding subunit YedZ [Rhodospirillales bacterium]